MVSGSKHCHCSRYSFCSALPHLIVIVSELMDWFLWSCWILHWGICSFWMFFLCFVSVWLEFIASSGKFSSQSFKNGFLLKWVSTERISCLAIAVKSFFYHHRSDELIAGKHNRMELLKILPVILNMQTSSCVACGSDDSEVNISTWHQSFKSSDHSNEILKSALFKMVRKK